MVMASSRWSSDVTLSPFRSRDVVVAYLVTAWNGFMSGFLIPARAKTSLILVSTRFLTQASPARDETFAQVQYSTVLYPYLARSSSALRLFWTTTVNKVLIAESLYNYSGNVLQSIFFSVGISETPTK
jgi:hypothetical protein